MINTGIAVTSSANAGCAITLDGVNVWIDALHEEKVAGFSTLSIEQQSKILDEGALGVPDIIIFTHCHPDHYSPRLLEQAIERWPQAKVYEPACFQGSSGCRIESHGLQLEFIRLTHDGKMFDGVEHYGVFIRADSGSVLFPGDCAVGDERLLEYCNGTSISLAILNFPWIALRNGRTALEKLSYEKLLICHLPFAEDDSEGYIPATHKAARRYLSGAEIEFSEAFLQKVIF